MDDAQSGLSSFALKRVATEYLSKTKNQDFLHGRPAVILTDGSKFKFNEVSVMGSVFQFRLISDEGGKVREQLCAVPVDKIVAFTMISEVAQ